MAEITKKRFSKGTIIFNEGDIQYWMYGISSGSVGVYTAYGTEEQRLITTMGKDQIFGEMGLLEAMPRSGTAVAMEDTVLEVIRNQDFKAYLTSSPVKCLRLMQIMSQRIRRLDHQYASAIDLLKKSRYLIDESENEELKSQYMELLKK